MPLRAPTEPLTDGVVRLRPLAAPDEAGMAELVADPEVLRFTLVPDPPPPGFAATWLARYVDGWAAGSLAGFAIERVGDGAWSGFASLVSYDAAGAQGELGYVTHPRARRQGVGGRALRVLAEWCLGPAGLVRVELRIEVANAGSLGVARRAGFSQEGTLRSVHVKNGRRADMTVWSRLASDP